MDASDEWVDGDWTLLSRDDTYFKVHSFILKYRSDVLWTMMEEELDLTYKTINFGEISTKALEALVEYLYGLKFNSVYGDPLTPDASKKIILFAEIFNIGGLRSAVNEGNQL